jgi:hypothetical protein
MPGYAEELSAQLRVRLILAAPEGHPGRRSLSFPFFGQAFIGYIAYEHIIGISWCSHND